MGNSLSSKNAVPAFVPPFTCEPKLYLRRCRSSTPHDTFFSGWMSGIEPPTSGTTIRRSNQLSYTHQRPLIGPYLLAYQSTRVSIQPRVEAEKLANRISGVKRRSEGFTHYSGLLARREPEDEYTKGPALC